MSCWDDFWADVVSETEACATVDLTEHELETLRYHISPQSTCDEDFLPQQSGAGALSASVALAAAAVVLVW